MCSARGLNGLLGATKRCILSLAVDPLDSLPFTPLVFVVVDMVSPFVSPLVVPLVRGTAEGMIVSNEMRRSKIRLLGAINNAIWKEGLWWFGGSSSSSCFGLTTERCRSVELPIKIVRKVDMIVASSLIRGGHTNRARLRRLICKLVVLALRGWRLDCGPSDATIEHFSRARAGRKFLPGSGIFGEHMLGNAISTWE